MVIFSLSLLCKSSFLELDQNLFIKFQLKMLKKSILQIQQTYIHSKHKRIDRCVILRAILHLESTRPQIISQVLHSQIAPSRRLTLILVVGAQDDALGSLGDTNPTLRLHKKYILNWLFVIDTTKNRQNRKIKKRHSSNLLSIHSHGIGNGPQNHKFLPVYSQSGGRLGTS